MITILFGFGYSISTAQDIPRRCATMEQDSINRARFPMRGSLQEFEDVLQQKIKEIQLRGTSGRIQTNIITIPIIVHVIHNGEAIGSGANLSQAQIMSQIEVLNEDYRKKAGTPGGASTNPVAADIEVEFCLSPVDENGVQMTEPGIDRVKGNKTSWTRQDIDGSLKSSTIWNPNLFYNIWTLKFGGTDSNLLGYAQFPDQSGLSGLDQTGGPATTDGVVIQYTSFGSVDKGNFPIMQAPYNKGRTLSHETGHWLGLRHIWGDGPCADDFVADTPTQQSESRGCPAARLACDGVTSAMVQNYMDYSDDNCMNIFTKGQKVRMQAVLEVSPRRTSVYQSNLCSPIVADVPTANFSSDKQTVLLGGVVNYTDLSSNFPTQWNWAFDGGDPSTSTLRDPKIKYSTPGSYKVSLVSANSLGDSQPLAIDSYITVSEEGLCGVASNYKPEFTSSLLRLSDFGNYKGYLTGSNSLKSQGFSELFANSAGYSYISGMKINFGRAYTTHEDAVVNVTVWNARGPQNGPGSIIETKQVLLKQIQDDIANNTPTTIVFDRETPVFSRAFQVGIQISYTNGDSLAIKSSANGEGVNSTSWYQDASGLWSRYTTTLGANIAMDIEPLVGVNPSVQVSASKLIVGPGAEVILNGRGASIFLWSADDNSVTDFASPQLIVHPTQTTTYIAKGSGLELCDSTASTTIYVSDLITMVDDVVIPDRIKIYPNPGSSFHLAIESKVPGRVSIQMHSVIGDLVSKSQSYEKSSENLDEFIDTSALKPGLYIVTIQFNKLTLIRKWIKP